MVELKDCPFCGGEADLRGHKAPEFWVGCSKIGCKATTEGFGDKERAITAWNTRPAPTDVGPLIERLAQFLHDEGGFGDAWTGRAWPDHEGDTGYRGGNAWTKIVPPDTVEHFRDVARRWFAIELATMPTEAATTLTTLQARVDALEVENAALRQAIQALRDGYNDAEGGLQYILQHHGRLSGVGFDRVFDRYYELVTMPEREGLLAGSHTIAARTGAAT